MNKIILAIILVSALPTIAAAGAVAASKAPTMQNSNPSPAQAQETVKEQAPEHVMNNSNPSPKQTVKQVPEHVMKNN